MVTLSEWYVQNTHKGFICNNCGKLFNKSDMERYLVARVRTGSGFHQSLGTGLKSSGIPAGIPSSEARAILDPSEPLEGPTSDLG